MRDIKSLDLNLLKAFDALFGERNVTRAADRLGFTQPAVSGMLARLRDNFDDPLFVRTQRGIVPTKRAEDLATPIRQILSDVGGLLQPAIFDPATAEFTVSVAATDYALHTVVLPILPKLRALAPGIKVAISAVESGHQQQLFERGEIDLGLVTPETAPQDLHDVHLFDETYVCAMREDHPEAGRKDISLDRFCELDQAVVSFSGERFHGVTDVALAKVGRQRRVVLSVTSFLALLDVLKTTDVIAVIPSRLARRDAGVVTVAPPIPVAGFSKILVWHDRIHRDAGLRWFRALILESIGAGYSPVEAH